MARFYIPPAVFRRLRTISTSVSHVEELHSAGRPVTQQLISAKELHRVAVSEVQKLSRCKDGATEATVVKDLKVLIKKAQDIEAKADRAAAYARPEVESLWPAEMAESAY